MVISFPQRPKWLHLNVGSITDLSVFIVILMKYKNNKKIIETSFL